MTDYLQNPGYVDQIKEAARRLDSMDYFELLNLPQNAPFDEIQARYRHLQRIYHPDRVFRDGDQELVRAVSRISKRLTEAYVTLRVQKNREKYVADLAGTDRASRLRFSAESAQEAKRERSQVLPKNDKARDLYLRAKKAFERGDVASAEKELKMAALFEASSPAIQELLAAIDAKKG